VWGWGDGLQEDDAVIIAVVENMAAVHDHAATPHIPQLNDGRCAHDLQARMRMIVRCDGKEGGGKRMG
jgi:hypothetical protein